MNVATAIALVVLVLGTMGSAAAKADGYTKADYEALVTQQSWNELLQHLPDTPPAKRDATWETFAEKASIGYLEEALRGDADVKAALELPRRYPYLKTLARFQAAWRKSVLAWTERCYESGGGAQKRDRCSRDLRELVEQSPQDWDLAFRAGKLIAAKDSPALAFQPFLRALAGKKDGKCADGDVRKAVVAALAERGTERARALELADGDCWKDLKAELEKKIDTESDDEFFQTTCGLFKKRGLLTGLRAKKCSA